jgi:hypothetical protein
VYVLYRFYSGYRIYQNMLKKILKHTFDYETKFQLIFKEFQAICKQFANKYRTHSKI